MSKINEEILDDNFNEPTDERVNLEDNLTIRFGRLMAIFSFGLGTILFLIGISDPSGGEVFIVGLYYTVIAFMVNLVYFLYLCIKSGTSEEKRGYRKTAGLMALNIPIAIIYFMIIMGSLW